MGSSTKNGLARLSYGVAGIVCAGVLLAPTGTRAEIASGSITITALIDGRSVLVIDGNQVSWNHFDYAGPGMHNYQTLPTEVSANNASGSNSYTWCPAWENGCNTCDGSCGELRESMTSLPLAIEPGLPPNIISAQLTPIACRYSCALWQSPAGGGAAIIDLDDNPPGGPATYTVRLDYTYETPECTQCQCSGGEISTPTIDVGVELPATVPCPKLLGGGSFGPQLKANISGQYASASCANECTSSVSVESELELQLQLCKQTYSASGSLGTDRETRYCKQCNTDSCQYECQSSSSCQKDVYSGTVQIGVERFLGSEWEWSGGPVEVTAECGVSVGVSGAVTLNGSATTNNGFCEGNCGNCKSVGADLALSGTGNAGCGLSVKWGSYMASLGCDNCLELNLDGQVGGTLQQGSDAVCQAGGCVHAGISASGTIRTPGFCFSAFGYNVQFQIETTATAECTADSCTGSSCTESVEGDPTVGGGFADCG
jgi:hypothetical protein